MIVPSHFVPLAAPGMVAMGIKWMANPESPFYIKPRFSLDLLRWGYRFWRASNPAQVRRAAPVLRDLHLASRAAYAELADAGENLGLVKNGLLMLCKSPEVFHEEVETAQTACRLGLNAKILDAAQAASLEPGIEMDIHGAIHYAEDCHLDPRRYVESREQALLAAGGQLVYDARATDWRVRGRTIEALLTTAGEIVGDQYVLAGGAWSPELARRLGLRLPLQAGKGYSVTHPHPVQTPQICAILVEARVAVTPLGGALRFGGTMEIAGMDERINSRRVQGILKSIPNYYPAFSVGDFAGIEPWQGLRPCSPDGLPYLGRTRVADNLLVATGHAMMGLSLAPVTGQIIAALVDREPSPIDLELLSPDRFG
jgi:D-amino-acid dehydrogenase